MPATGPTAATRLEEENAALGRLREELAQAAGREEASAALPFLRQAGPSRPGKAGAAKTAAGPARKAGRGALAELSARA